MAICPLHIPHALEILPLPYHDINTLPVFVHPLSALARHLGVLKGFLYSGYLHSHAEDILDQELSRLSDVRHAQISRLKQTWLDSHYPLSLRFSDVPKRAMTKMPPTPA